jgi:hypothetical protein
MPKSISVPLVISLLFTLVVAILDALKNASETATKVSDKYSNLPSYAPNKELLLSAFSQAFSFTTIAAFFLILAFSEKATSAAFGKVVRDNLSTIIVALGTSAVFGAIEIVSILGKLVTF